MRIGDLLAFNSPSSSAMASVDINAKVLEIHYTAAQYKHAAKAMPVAAETREKLEMDKA